MFVFILFMVFAAGKARLAAALLNILKVFASPQLRNTAVSILIY
jgi:hypothetical protein